VCTNGLSCAVRTATQTGRRLYFTLSFIYVRQTTAPVTYLLIGIVQVLVCENGEWRMQTVDESKPRGGAPPFCQRLLKQAPFHIAIQLLVLLNALVAASMHFDHRTPTSTRNNDTYTWYYYTEVCANAAICCFSAVVVVVVVVVVDLDVVIVILVVVVVVVV